MDDVDVGDEVDSGGEGGVDTSWQLAETGDLRRSFVVAGGGRRVAVDPEGAVLDITDHMGETVLTTGGGESLPAAVGKRLDAVDRSVATVDGQTERWDSGDRQATYREARLEPGDNVHVAGGVVDSVPEWRSDVAATVAAPEDGGLVIREGTTSGVVQKHVGQFVTGTVVGLGVLALGLHVVGVVDLL
jgi:hypothetical protein